MEGFFSDMFLELGTFFLFQFSIRELLRGYFSTVRSIPSLPIFYKGAVKRLFFYFSMWGKKKSRLEFLNWSIHIISSIDSLGFL